MDEQRFKYYIALLKQEFPSASNDFIYQKAMEMHDKYIKSISYDPSNPNHNVYDEQARKIFGD